MSGGDLPCGKDDFLGSLRNSPGREGSGMAVPTAPSPPLRSSVTHRAWRPDGVSVWKQRPFQWPALGRPLLGPDGELFKVLQTEGPWTHEHFGRGGRSSRTALRVGESGSAGARLGRLFSRVWWCLHSREGREPHTGPLSVPRHVPVPPHPSPARAWLSSPGSAVPPLKRPAAYVWTRL